MALDILKLQFDGQDNTRRAIESVNAGIDSIKKNTQSLSGVRVDGSFFSGFSSGIKSTSSELGGLKGAIGGLKSSGDSTFRSLARGAADLGSSLAGLGKTAALSFGALSSVGLFKGVRGSADIERISADLTVLTGSAEAARKVFNDLREFADLSPFSISDLAETANKLATVEKNTDRVVLRTKQLGEVAGGDAAKMKLLALAFSQVAGKGRLTGQELNQLTENGFFNLRQELTKVTGLAGEKLAKALERGEISFNTLEKALDSATEGFPRTAAAAKTLDGQMSTLGDTIQSFLNDAVTKSGAFEILKVGVSSLTSVLSGKSSLSGAANDAAAKIAGIIPKSISAQISAVTETVKTLSSRLIDLANRFGITALLTSLAAAVGAVGAELGKIDFNAIVAGITNFTDRVDIDLIKSFATVLIVGKTSLIALGLAASAAAAAVGVFGAALKLLPIFAVISAISLLYYAWTKNFLGIKDVTNGLLFTVTNASKSIAVIFGVTIPSVLQTFNSVWTQSWGQVGSIFSGVWGAIRFVAITAINSIILAITGFLNTFSDTFNTLSSKIKEITGVSIGSIDRIRVQLLSLEDPVDVKINTVEARRQIDSFFSDAKKAINAFSKNQAVINISNALGASGARRFIEGVTGGDTGGVIGNDGVFRRMAGGQSGLIPTGGRGKHGESEYLMRVHAGEHLLNPKIPHQKEMIDRAYQITAPASSTNININISGGSGGNQSDIIAEVTRKLRLAL